MVEWRLHGCELLRVIVLSRESPKSFKCSAAWLRSAIICLLLGAATTVLSVAALRPIAKLDHAGDANLSWKSAEGDRFWVYHPEHGDVVLMDWGHRPLLYLGNRVVGYTPVRQERMLPVVPPGKDSAFARRPPDHAAPVGLIEERLGWPFLALRSVVERRQPPDEGGDEEVRTRGAILIFAGDSPVSGRSWLALPLRPIWPGFALNSLLFAVPVAGVMMAVRLLRLVRLHRRDSAGLCIWCRYELGSLSTCPECGRSRGPWRHKVLAGVIKGRRTDGPRASG